MKHVFLPDCGGYLECEKPRALMRSLTSHLEVWSHAKIAMSVDYSPGRASAREARRAWGLWAIITC